MRLVTFDPYRSLGMHGVEYIKPELVFTQRKIIDAADWLLFPEYWQVNFLVYAYKKRIFPNINTYHLGHDKIEMTRAFQALVPAHVPDTRILASTPSSQDEILDTFTFPFVAKEARNSMGRGVFLIEQRSDFIRYAEANSVLYVQEYLPISRDLRVVYIGNRVVTAYWRNAPEKGFHNNVAQGGTMSFADIPEQALQLADKVATGLGINHAGFDIAEVNGHYYLLEFNTLFGNSGLTEQNINSGAIIMEYLKRQIDTQHVGRVSVA